MKNVLLIVIISFLFCNITIAQEKSDKHKKKKPIRFAHKVQPVQLFTGNIKYAFEASLSEKQSLELELNCGCFYKTIPQIIFDEREFFRVSEYALIKYKFYTKERRNKRLNGFYFAPTLMFGGFSGSRSRRDFRSRGLNDYIAGTVDVGYQVWRGKFVVDFFAGIGYSSDGNDGDFSPNNSHLHWRNTALRMGIRTGFVHR